jgi:hypothetical protein
MHYVTICEKGKGRDETLLFEDEDLGEAIQKLKPEGTIHHIDPRS